ncbi:MAG: hypothetical protein JWQ25_167 [Daejeonella sp.]|nr:hypothetical protein [Daejeonella sp.]
MTSKTEFLAYTAARTGVIRLVEKLDSKPIKDNLLRTDFGFIDSVFFNNILNNILSPCSAILKLSVVIKTIASLNPKTN